MQIVPLQFTGGLDRSHTPQSCPPNSLYQLKGFRQRPSAPGVLEQTPYYYQLQQTTQGSYNNGGGTLTEATASAVVARIPDPLGSGTFITLTDYVAIDGGSAQLQVFNQVTVPAANTINTHCFIVINNIAALALTLGNSLDVVIDAATTFKWQKNGAGYTTGLACSTTGTAIDGGNATVYFLTAAGFSVNDTWSWRRTDAIYDVGAAQTKGNPLQYESFGTETYFISNTGRLNKITSDSSSVAYGITGGYRPVYGRHLTVFYGHLVVAGYATTNATRTSRVIAWSDNIDINCFFPTDVNEADTYSIPRVGQTAVLGGTGSTLRGCFVWNNTLFALSSDRIYYTSYLGLPNVFSFAVFRDFQAGSYTTGVNYPGDVCVAVGSTKGVYIISAPYIYLFDGANLQCISNQLRGVSVTSPASAGQTSGCSPLSIHYVPATKELYVRDSFAVLHVFQEELGTWYTRYASFASAGALVSCIDVAGGVGIPSRKLLFQDFEAAGAVAPVFDETSGTVFGTPTITTQVLTGGLVAKVKEVSGGYAQVYFKSGISATYYSTAANCVLTIKWYVADSGQIIGAAVSNVANVLTSASVDGTISFPRTSFRGLAIQFELTGLTAGKPPALVWLQQLDLNMVSWPVPVATR